MPDTRTRPEKLSIIFLMVWNVVWSGMMIVVLFTMGRMVLAGEVAPVLFMLVWLTVAGFGLYKGITKLRTLFLEGRKPPAPTRNQTWHDRMSDHDT